MRRKKGSFTDVITVITVAVMFSVILLLVVFSAVSYRYSTVSAGRNSDERAALSYILNSVRDSGDSGIYIADRGGIECLVIEDGEGFEQRFYEHEGMLAEEYVISGSEPDPDNALLIGGCGNLQLSMDDNGLLMIKTDKGVSYANTGRHRSHGAEQGQ